MIITVEELRQHVNTAMEDQALEAMLQALELLVQGRTNNNFRKYIGEDGKIDYPADVKMGVVNLMKWEMKNREKVGIESETLSRKSVTYYKMDKDNTAMSYPASMLGFLEPYMKARFGQGLSV